MRHRPIEVTGQRTALGEWATASRPPADRLRPFVGPYQGYAERTPGPSLQRQFPSGSVTLIISLGEPLEVDYPLLGTPAGTHNTFVAGLHESYATTLTDGSMRGVQLNLTPLGASMLLGLPMPELANRVIELEDVLGPAACRLEERLREAPGWRARFALLDAVLEACLDRAEEPPLLAQWAWGRLVASHGSVAVGDLAAEAGVTPKRLATAIREQVGLRPKAAARVLRFRRALDLATSAAAPRWIDVAAAAGYYDQAHLNRDFRAIAGAPPREVLAMLRPGSAAGA